MKLDELFFAELMALSENVDHLPLYHAVAACRTRQNCNCCRGTVARDIRIHCADRECVGQKTVPCQSRIRLTEDLVVRRLSAAEIVIVHARKVVVDKRICMHHLNGARKR